MLGRIKDMLKSFFSRAGEHTEEIILIIAIIMGILDFLELLSPDMDYLNNFMAWAALGYLIYQVDLTLIFFGECHKVWDFLLIMSFFMLCFIKNNIAFLMSTLNSLVEMGAKYWANLFPIPANFNLDGATVVNVVYSSNSVNLNAVTGVPVGEAINSLAGNLTFTSILPPTPNHIVLNVSNDISSRLFELQPQFLIHRWINYLTQPDVVEAMEKASLLLGLLLLLFLAFYFTLRFNVREPSLMSVLHESGSPCSPKQFRKFSFRFIIVFLMLFFFYIIFFNLMMEWLAIGVDAPLLVIGIIFYLIVWIKHHKKLDAESLLFKIGNFGLDFYENVLKLLYSKKGLFIIISGALVLHSLTDVGVFLLPSTIGVYDQLYYNQLGTVGHYPVFSIIGFFTPGPNSLFGYGILASPTLLGKFLVSYLYIFNYIAILFLLVTPSVLWYYIFSRKKYEVPKIVLAVFFSAFACIILTPAFVLQGVGENSAVSGLVGVDILTKDILMTAEMPFHVVVIISIIAGIIIYLLSFKQKFKDYIVFSAAAFSVVFFAYYIYLYFFDICSYYFSLVLQNYHEGAFFFSGYFLLFLVLTVLFYVGGFIIFIYELVEDRI